MGINFTLADIIVVIVVVVVVIVGVVVVVVVVVVVAVVVGGVRCRRRHLHSHVFCHAYWHGHWSSSIVFILLFAVTFRLPLNFYVDSHQFCWPFICFNVLPEQPSFFILGSLTSPFPFWPLYAVVSHGHFEKSHHGQQYFSCTAALKLRRYEVGVELVTHCFPKTGSPACFYFTSLIVHVLFAKGRNVFLSTCLKNFKNVLFKAWGSFHLGENRSVVFWCRSAFRSSWTSNTRATHPITNDSRQTWHHVYHVSVLWHYVLCSYFFMWVYQ